jgi:transmembrane sensor
MRPDGRSPFNAQIVEEASEWLIEFRLGDVDTLGRREFDTWIRASPQHLRAYLEVAAIWNESGSLEAHRDLDSRALVALARAERNVVPLREVLAQDPLSVPRGSSRLTSKRGGVPSFAAAPTRLLALSLALSLALVAAGGIAITLWSLNRGVLYATAVGERRSLRLDDGSAVELDSRSRIRVRFSRAQREVELLEGQVLVRVAKDSQRPFVVSSDSLRVRALGTQFDINRATAGTTVTVVEGRVAVSGSGNSEPVLTAGEQLTVGDRTHRAAPLHTNTATATAWTQGQLVLESATLTDVADVFNRYSTRQLTVADSGTRPLRLSGVFATDPEFLLRYLRQRPDIALEEGATAIHIVRR